MNQHPARFVLARLLSPARLGLVLHLAASLSAQVAPAPAPGSAVSSEANPAQPAVPVSLAEVRRDSAVELSPFVVKEEKGWVATETTAGTRLRTDLRDVPNEIEVFTRDFMDDLALNSINDALIYSINAENNDEFMATNAETSSFYTNDGGRVRGIGAGSKSVGMFQSNITSDNYNLDGVSLVSGPNSTLFGLGSPSGTFDAMPSPALFRNKASTRLQYSSETSKRVTLDLNRVLIPRILTVRLMGLWKKEETHRKPNHDDDKRLTGAVTFQPFKNTVVRARIERVDRDQNRVARTAAYDSVSLWLYANKVPGSPYTSGKPGFDNRTAIPNNLTTTSRIFTTNNNWATLIANDPSAPVMSWAQAVRVQNPSAATAYGVPDADFDAGTDRTFLDEAIVPFDVNPFGELKETKMGGRTKTIVVEQKLLPNLFLELAANREDSHMDIFGPRGQNLSAIDADANLYLPVRLPGQTAYVANPNFGKYYVEYTPSAHLATYRNTDWRATLSYEWDLKSNHSGWRRWLGTHRFAGMRSRNESLSVAQQNMAPRILDEPLIPGRNLTAKTATNWAIQSTRQLMLRSYLDESFQPISGVGAMDQPIKYVDGNGQTFYTTGGAYSGLVADSGKRLSTSTAVLTGNKLQTDTLLFAWQGRFLPDRKGNNRLILTYGYRDDGVRSALPDVASRTQDTGVGRSGFYPLYLDTTWDAFGATEKGLTRNTGAVLRLLPWLSVHYNKSSTFDVNSGKFSPFGVPYPGAQGDGKDYGIRLELWQGKLNLNLNKYVNVLGPSRADNTINGYRSPFNIFETRIRVLDPNLASPANWFAAPLNYGYSNYNVYSDRRSEGYEFELKFRPLPKWNIMIKGAKSTPVESNIGKDWIEWVKARTPVWQSVVAKNGEVDGAGRPVTWLTADVDASSATENRTLKQYYDEQIGYNLAFMKAADGRATDGAREMRANLITSYQFSEGTLKGVSLTGGVRWLPPPVTGYAIRVDPTGGKVLDVTHAFRGKAELYFDTGVKYGGRMRFLRGMGYTVQLNIKNLLNQDRPIPFTAFSNGEIARMATVEPRLFILTCSFEF